MPERIATELGFTKQGGRYEPFVSRRNALSLLGAATLAIADEAKADDSGVRAVIDGAYTLEEWHIDENVFRPPTVEGRIVFLNGAIVTILTNKIQPDRQITVALFGIYQLGTELFSYRYDNASVFIQTGSTITASRRPPFEGMRDFDIAREGAAVRLQSRSSEHAEFVFNAEGQRYSEGGKLMRVWRRAISQ